MTSNKMHISFKVGVDKAESFDYPSFEAEEIDLFLNKAQDRFIKNRYGINNPMRQGFEESQKRTDDLREVVKAEAISSFSTDANSKPFGKYVSLPADYWFSIQEEADIAYYDAASGGGSTITAIVVGKRLLVTSGSITENAVTYNIGESFVTDGTGTVSSGSFRVTKSHRAGVKPVQHDDYNKVANDPFNKPKSDQARRLMIGDKVELLSSSEFDILSFYLRYIKKPDVIEYNVTDCELAEHTHEEIVDIAVSIALEGIESNRYQTNLNELNKTE